MAYQDFVNYVGRRIKMIYNRDRQTIMDDFKMGDYVKIRISIPSLNGRVAKVIGVGNSISISFNRKEKSHQLILIEPIWKKSTKKNLNKDLLRLIYQ